MKRDLVQIGWATLCMMALLLVSVVLYQDLYAGERALLTQSPSHTVLSSEKRATPVLIRSYDLKTIEKRYQSIVSEIDDYRCSIATVEQNLSLKETNATDQTRIFSEMNLTASSSASQKDVTKEQNVTIEKASKFLKSASDRSIHNRPRLAIIMDDVHSYENAYAIKKIPFPITPSIFPASSTHPDTPRIAQLFDHYMVHLPMEAVCYDNPEEQTLCITDGPKRIARRLQRIHRDFPRCIAINNHTGSKFTSDPVAMNRFFKVFSKYGIPFIDSRTSPRSVVKKIAARYRLKIRERNIFLDNEPDVGYIQSQLKEAVAYAKRHGKAIAICHPRPETFRALMQSQGILQDVDLVYVNAL